MRLRPAYTLIEMVLSMAITTVLIGGMASSLVIASRAADPSADPAARTVRARQAIDQITADLTHATALTAQSSSSVTFCVPDRDGNGTIETISYDWSLGNGDILTRDYNGTGAATILDNVDFFSLAWVARPNVVPQLVEYDGEDLFEYDSPLGGLTSNYYVSSTEWRAQYFKPDLPTNTISWGVETVELVVDRVNSGRTVLFEIRSATPRQSPTSTVLGVVSASSTSLPVITSWVQVNFSGVTGLDPGSGACLVVRQASGTAGAEIRVHSSGLNMPRHSHFMTSIDSGATWTAPGHTLDLLIKVTGAYTTQGAAQ